MYKSIIRVIILIGVWQLLNNSSALARDNSKPKLIKVKRIEFVGNTVFSDSELKKVLTPLPNQPVSLNRLLQLRSEITDFYVNRGYISSGAFLKQQQFKNGVVTIQVVEAKLAQVEIRGRFKLKKSYITSRLPVGEPLNKETLLLSLGKLNDDPAIKKISGELVRLTPNRNNLILDVEENRALTSQLSLNNYFSPSIGGWGGTGSLRYHLLGYGDYLSINYSRTAKSGLVRYGVNYSIPFNFQNGTINFSYSNADSKIVEEPIASAIDIQSDLQLFKLSLRQPVALSRNSNLTFEVAAEHIQTQTLVDDFSFAFTKGLDDGKVTLSALRLGQEFSTKNASNSFVVRSQFNLGVDLLGATVTETGIDGIFWSWQGQGEWIKKIDNIFLVIGANVQLSGDKLLPIEQLSLGGNGSVRGYRENLSIGDNGAIANVEVQIPLFNFANERGVIKIVPFIDAGTIWNNSEETILQDTLVSAGLGLDLELKEWLQAYIDYSVPLVKTDLPKDFSEEAITFNLVFQR